MPIQWFPGHMHATKKTILDRMKGIDVVIEMLDARLPGSSSNPLLAELTQGKPALKVLNKQDLADADRTALWLSHFQALPDTRALALDARAGTPVQHIVDACRLLAPSRGGMVKPLRVLICGIPNVGKSTVINSLAGRSAAKTGDEPGITKNEQKIVLASDVYLYDTPGMLWPRILVEESGLHLAASGAVGRNAFDDEEVALALIATLERDYPGRLQARYAARRADAAPIAVSASGADATATAADAQTPDQRLADIGRRRGGVLPGGRVNLQKAAEIVLNDFRQGMLGRITLETPEQYGVWLAAALVREDERKARLKGRTRRAATAGSRDPRLDPEPPEPAT